MPRAGDRSQTNTHLKGDSENKTDGSAPSTPPTSAHDQSQTADPTDYRALQCLTYPPGRGHSGSDAVLSPRSDGC